MESTLGIPGGVASTIPSGTIVMFSGSTIPTGWAICNGQNGTPDLRDRFIVGAGKSYNPGATGGSDTVTLTMSQMPQHSHTITGGSHSHTISGGSHTHSLSGTLSGSIEVWLTSGWGSGLSVSGGIRNGYNSGDADLSVNLSGSIGNATPSMTCDNASPNMSAANAGSGGSHENRPPYYALYFIMKL